MLKRNKISKTFWTSKGEGLFLKTNFFMSISDFFVICFDEIFFSTFAVVFWVFSYEFFYKYFSFTNCYCLPHSIVILSLFTAGKTIFFKSWNIMESSKRSSKYHLSINLLAHRKTVFRILEKFKTRPFQ